MTTIAETSSVARPTAGRGRFYVRMAALFLAVAIIGFIPTYWMPMARGTLDVAPITHLHALFFYSWMLLFLWQTSLVAAGKVVRHREWGVAGVAIASATCVVSLGMSINSIKHFGRRRIWRCGARLRGRAGNRDSAVRRFACVGAPQHQESGGS